MLSQLSAMITSIKTIGLVLSPFLPIKELTGKWALSEAKGITMQS